MKIGKMIILTVGILILVLLDVRCTQPPIEKISSLQIDLHDSESKGAKVFAQTEYEMITAKMTELNNFMNQKKYAKANNLIDTLTVDIENMKTALRTNGMEMGSQQLELVYTEIDRMKNLLKPENYKLISQNESKSYEMKAVKFEKRASELKTDLNNDAFLRVYNGSKALENEIAHFNDKTNRRFEQAGAVAKKNK